MKASHQPKRPPYLRRRRGGRSKLIERLLALAGLFRGSRLPDDIRLAAS